MPSGLDNKLVGQIGEFLACAELGKRGYVATPFSGNVPGFDVVVANRHLDTCTVQVKANAGGSWRFWAGDWLDIVVDPETGKQVWTKLSAIANPTLLHILVRVSRDEKDRFFVLTRQELQAVCVAAYAEWMNPRDWIRPKSRESMENRIAERNVVAFEDRWGLIDKALNGSLLPYDEAGLHALYEACLKSVITGDHTDVMAMIA